MKRLGRVLGNLLAVTLTIASLQAMAETQSVGRDFNHMTTGYPLSGGHAIAACESCHVGGVFKGTPKNCDGCHAVGRRVLATPKSNAHIVTDAQCESCHFNTSTWLGARFSHNMVTPGGCTTCHNGRTAQAKTSSARHSSVAGQNSCDTCHRTSTWMVAGWNHTNTATINYTGQSCDSAQCHSATGLANTKTVSLNPKHLPYPGPIGGVTFTSCQNCHIGYSSFSVVKYSHPGGLNCTDCHNTTYVLGAVRAMPTNHIPLTGGACQTCHTSTASWGTITMGATGHALVSSVCKSCHLTGTSYLGRMDKKSYGHEGMGSGDDCSKSGCHKPLGTRGTAYIRWD